MTMFDVIGTARKRLQSLAVDAEVVCKDADKDVRGG